MMIRAAAVRAVSSRSHQHIVMAHGITSNGQALLGPCSTIIQYHCLWCRKQPGWHWVVVRWLLLLGHQCWRVYLIASGVCSCNLPVCAIPIDPIPGLFYFGDWDTSNILSLQPSFSLGWSWVFANKSLLSLSHFSSFLYCFRLAVCFLSSWTFLLVSLFPFISEPQSWRLKELSPLQLRIGCHIHLLVSDSCTCSRPAALAVRLSSLVIHLRTPP